MRNTLLAAIVVTLTTSSAVAAQQRYARAEENQNHELIITTSTGERIMLSKGRDRAIDEDQENFGSIAISADRAAVGWLAYFPNCCTSYPIPTRVEVYSGGQRRSFTPAIVAWDWCFVDGSARIAALSTTVHGPQNQILELWDVATGIKLDSFTWMEDGKYPRAPAWVNSIRADYELSSDARTHTCSTKQK
jgi:hypothetical protein